MDASISSGEAVVDGKQDFAMHPEGEIDPCLRTISFWNDDRCLLELHAYATHPMSYYGKGEVSSDFVGLARHWRQRELPNVKQMYASGCSGDVTAGKYNDGSVDARMGLAQKLQAAMKRSHDATEKWPCSSIRFDRYSLELNYTNEESLQPEVLRQRLQQTSLAVEQRILAAMGLGFLGTGSAEASHRLVGLDLGGAKLMLFPGETFVGYQLLAQELSPSSPGTLHRLWRQLVRLLADERRLPNNSTRAGSGWPRCAEPTRSRHATLLNVE